MMMRTISLTATLMVATALVGCGQPALMTAAPTAAVSQAQAANSTVVTVIKTALEKHFTDMTVSLSNVTVKAAVKASTFTFTATKTTVGFTGRPTTETISGVVDMTTRKVVETVDNQTPETLGVAADIEKAMTVRIPDASTSMVVTFVTPTQAPFVYQFSGIKTTTGFALRTSYDVTGIFNSQTKAVKLTSQKKLTTAN